MSPQPASPPVETRFRAQPFDPQREGVPAADLPNLFSSPSCLRRVLDRVAPLQLPVLLHGDPGRGRTWAARALHGLSGRPGPLLEAEPAVMPAQGPSLARVWARARAGTLVLRGIDRIPPGQQAELGTLLDEETTPGVVMLVDGDPEEAVANGRLRRDLLDRTLSVEVDPVRRRPEDAVPALEVFLARAARRADSPVPELHDVTRVRLRAHLWPGDYAQLERFADRAVALGSVEGALTMLGSGDPLGTPGDDLWDVACRRIGDGRPVSLERVRRRLVRRAENVWIDQVLRRVRGDAHRAAEVLGVTPSSLEARIRGARS